MPKWGLRNCRGEEGRVPKTPPILLVFTPSFCTCPGGWVCVCVCELWGAEQLWDGSLKCANAETTFTCYTQRNAYVAVGCWEAGGTHVCSHVNLGKFTPHKPYPCTPPCSCVFFAHFIIFYDCTSIIFWHGGKGNSNSNDGSASMATANETKTKRNGTTSFAISGPVPQQEGRNQEATGGRSQPETSQMAGRKRLFIRLTWFALESACVCVC